MKFFMRSVRLLCMCLLLCGCSVTAQRTVSCPGLPPEKQESLQALSEGCEVEDICNATMGEFMTCWRKEKVTIEAAKKALDASSHPHAERFVETYQDGDEVWHYASPDGTWKFGLGSEGYAVFRDGKLAGAVETRIR